MVDKKDSEDTLKLFSFYLLRTSDSKEATERSSAQHRSESEVLNSAVPKHSGGMVPKKINTLSSSNDLVQNQ